MKIDVAAEDAGAQHVLQTLLERYVASGEKARPLRLDERRVRQFSRSAQPGEADATWEALKTFEAEGIIAIGAVRPKPGKAPYELAPLVRLHPAQASRAAELIGFPLDRDPWTKSWMAACDQATWLPEDLRVLLASRPHRLGERAAAEVLERWKTLLEDQSGRNYIRQAAAAAFWGVSKALDERVELVNLLRQRLGRQPFLESPIQLLVHTCGGVCGPGVLFIENQVTFELAKRGRVGPASRLDIVYTAGFRASTARLRDAMTASVYASETSRREDVQGFTAWLFSNDNRVPTYFWGDLDYAGLSILRGMRQVFPNLRAWPPGYDALVALVRAGIGHPIAEDPHKGEQRTPGCTGCEYADAVLLPAIEETGLFHDQEGA